MKTNTHLYVCYLFVLTLLILACDSKRVYEKNIEIPNSKWNKGNIVKYEVEINDTINLHNIYLNIRNTSNYPFSNLYLFITITSPSGENVTDTVECALADVSGKWIGRGFGHIRDNQVLYKKNARFPVSGKYTFGYVQAMRKDNLLGISDVGLKIERAN